ncbi:hypothetical protein [Pseudoalteromonas sp.]|uniref:hypothetical protein n=1 Tax=Pseudoalteromonas sp. TaxID=53249 RepID=UPI00261CEBA0|nr:hypothetical protein [Pseudoalteromonas sp.]MCP4587984.1 hypothetical protein [Pseudoalteromonas sp.]
MYKVAVVFLSSSNVAVAVVAAAMAVAAVAVPAAAAEVVAKLQILWLSSSIGVTFAILRVDFKQVGMDQKSMFHYLMCRLVLICLFQLIMPAGTYLWYTMVHALSFVQNVHEDI